MNIFSAIRETVRSLAALITGIFFRIVHPHDAPKREEHCHVCEAYTRPSLRAIYVIRTGPRAHLSGFDLPTMFPDVHVCAKHHPDRHVDDAVWSHETQEVLKKLNVAGQCVLLHQ